MKKLNTLLKFTLIAVLGLMVFSCNPDEADSPTVTLESGTDLISADASYAANSLFKVRVRGVKGGTDLKTLTIQVDGSTIDASRVSGDIASGVALIPAGDVDQFTYDINILSHGAGSSEYSFILADEGGEQDVVKINISVTSGPLSIVVTDGENHVQVASESLVPFKFTASKGEADIAKVAVYDAAGNLLTKDMLRWNDSGVEFENNPLDITGIDVSGFEKTIYILASAYGINKYTVEIEDANGDKASVDVTVLVGQAFDTLYNVTVFNADGPQFGSVDLHTGSMVSSSDASRDLMDGGIDLAQPVDTNWKRTFKAVQGATMVALNGGDFAAIASREQAETMFNAGTEIAETNALDVNDVIIVRADLDGDLEFDYFVINIDETNNTTGMDNNDNFVISIKPSLDK